MRVLVTGANGFVGTHLCQQLLNDGHEVVAAVRNAHTAPDQTSEFVSGDLSGSVNWASALTGVDAVVHLAARVHVMREASTDPVSEFRRINRDATVTLAKASEAAGVRRFIYMSSIKVNGERTMESPFEASSIPNPTDPYAVSKWEAELALGDLAASSEMSIISVRAPLVYGPGVRGNMARLLGFASSGYPVPLGSIRNRRTMISVWNLVDLLAFCSTASGLGSGVVLAGDPHSPSTPELFRLLASAVGVKARIFNFPVSLLHIIGSLTGKSNEISRLCDSLEVTTSSSLVGFDWAAPLSFQDGVLRFGTQWRRDGKR